jgi:hypothetical protein
MYSELQQIQVKASLTSALDAKCSSTWLRGKRGALCGHSIRLRVGSRVEANGAWAMRKKSCHSRERNPGIAVFNHCFITECLLFSNKSEKKRRNQICIANSLVRKMSARTSAPLHPFLSNNSKGQLEPVLRIIKPIVTGYHFILAT